EEQTDRDAAIVVHTRRMIKEPERECDHDDRQAESNATEQATEAPRTRLRRERAADEEPLNDRTNDREQHEHQWDAVSAIFGRNRLRPECACRTTGRMSQTEPGATDRTAGNRRRLRLEHLRFG